LLLVNIWFILYNGWSARRNWGRRRTAFRKERRQDQDQEKAGGGEGLKEKKLEERVKFEYILFRVSLKRENLRKGKVATEGSIDSSRRVKNRSSSIPLLSFRLQGSTNVR